MTGTGAPARALENLATSASCVRLYAAYAHDALVRARARSCARAYVCVLARLSASVSERAARTIASGGVGRVRAHHVARAGLRAQRTQPAHGADDVPRGAEGAAAAAREKPRAHGILRHDRPPRVG
eukprot:6173022-Pleurochrysis_carterae.AAC.1